MIAPASDEAENFSGEKFGRPLCLMIPFWGQRYRDYFVDLCLPSLLAPNNLPILEAADGHRLLVATTADDWTAIKNLPIVQKLEQHATLTLVEIDHPRGKTEPGSSDAIKQQNVCWKRLVEKAFELRGYGSLLSPDCIVPDGMIASLRKQAAAGHQLVISPALRQIEEPLLGELKERGLMPTNSRLSQAGMALTISPRDLASLAVRHLHPEVAIFEGGSPDWPFSKPYWFWRVPECEGFILRSHFGVPVLMDYSIVQSHNVDCLDRDMFENTYLASNFSGCERVHVVQDSDEFMIVSVTPESTCQRSPPTHTLKWLSNLDPCFSVRVSMGVYARRDKDPLKRDIFRHPIRWHGKELNEAWRRAERRNSEIIDRAVGDYFETAVNVGRHNFPGRLTLDVHRLPAELVLLWFENARFRQMMRPIQLLARNLARLFRRS